MRVLFILFMVTANTGVPGNHVRAAFDNGMYHVATVAADGTVYYGRTTTGSWLSSPLSGHDPAWAMLPPAIAAKDNFVVVAWTSLDLDAILVAQSEDYGTTWSVSRVHRGQKNSVNRPDVEISDGRVWLLSQHQKGLMLSNAGNDEHYIYEVTGAETQEPQYPSMHNGTYAWASYKYCRSGHQSQVAYDNGHGIVCPKEVPAYPAGVDLVHRRIAWLEWTEDTTVIPQGGYYSGVRLVNLDTGAGPVISNGTLIGNDELPPVPQIGYNGSDYLVCWNTFYPAGDEVYCRSDSDLTLYDIGPGKSPSVVWSDQWVVFYSNGQSVLTKSERLLGSVTTPDPTATPTATSQKTPTPTPTPTPEDTKHRGPLSIILGILLVIAGLLLGGN